MGLVCALVCTNELCELYQTEGKSVEVKWVVQAIYKEGRRLINAQSCGVLGRPELAPSAEALTPSREGRV